MIKLKKKLRDEFAIDRVINKHKEEDLRIGIRRGG